MGGLLGGAKRYVGPPSQIIGGAWPPLAPPLPTPMCFVQTMRHVACDRIVMKHIFGLLTRWQQSRKRLKKASFDFRISCGGLRVLSKIGKNHVASLLTVTHSVCTLRISGHLSRPIWSSWKKVSMNFYRFSRNFNWPNYNSLATVLDLTLTFRTTCWTACSAVDFVKNTSLLKGLLPFLAVHVYFSKSPMCGRQRNDWIK